MPGHRVRSSHPGVVLAGRRNPSGEVVWRARYTDPDTGRRVWETLERSLSTREARRAWAIQKSHALSLRRAALASGAPLRTETPLDGAVDGFYEACRNRIADSTIQTYRRGIELLRHWAHRLGIVNTEDLTPPRLRAFRETVIAAHKCVVNPGSKRGARRMSAAKRSPATTNTELKAVAILMNHWRRLGLVPQLHSDTISDALEPLRVSFEQPNFMAPAALQGLLEAALRHDADTFLETREEHAGERTAGTTRRFPPIAPFVAYLLLTGCRRGEALAVQWSDADLDALDHQGKKVGEIRLSARTTKTRRARTIGLEVSPALRRMLASMKLRAGRDAVYVFGASGPYTVEFVEAARKRLVREYGAPAFNWQLLRSTCATYLTCSSGIWGSATVFLSARQLGHAVAVAERHYLGVHRGIPRHARTLEAAMQIQTPLSRLLAAQTNVRQKARLRALDSRDRKHGSLRAMPFEERGEIRLQEQHPSSNSNGGELSRRRKSIERAERNAEGFGGEVAG